MSFVSKLITSLFLLITSHVLVTCYKIQSITAPEEGILDSPQWSVQENALYWVSAFGQKLFRMDGDTGEIMTRDVYCGQTFFIIPVRDHPDYVLVAVGKDVNLLKWGASGGDSAFRRLATVDSGLPDNNINDCKADAAGRLWFGTFGKLNFSLSTLVPLDQATLYSMDACNYAQPAIKKRPVSLSNGIAWSLNNKKMYYNDSPTRKIVAFDYDLKNGAIANETAIFYFDDYKIPGVPDGLTIDKDGNLWCATFNRWALQINPKSGELLRKIKLPVDQVTSLMWGGRGLNILYATTGNLNISDPLPKSGSLLMITDLGTKGVPENQFVFPKAPYY